MGTASNQIPAKNSNVQSDPDEEIRRRLEKLKAPGMNKKYIYILVISKKLLKNFY